MQKTQVSAHFSTDQIMPFSSLGPPSFPLALFSTKGVGTCSYKRWGRDPEAESGESEAEPTRSAFLTSGCPSMQT